MATHPLSWTNVVAVISLFLVVFGGGWTLFQTQISSMERMLKEVQASSERRDNAIRDELQRREAEIKTQIRDIEAELQRRRLEFMSQAEFGQFRNNADDRWKTQADINRKVDDAYVNVKTFEVWKKLAEERMRQTENNYIRAVDELHRVFRPTLVPQGKP